MASHVQVSKRGAEPARGSCEDVRFAGCGPRKEGWAVWSGAKSQKAALSGDFAARCGLDSPPGRGRGRVPGRAPIPRRPRVGRIGGARDDGGRSRARRPAV